MRLNDQAELTVGRRRRIGEAFGGFEDGREGFQESIGMGQFQDAIHHTCDAGETKRASGGFQTGETIHEFSQASAVQLGDSGKIEDDASAVLAEQLIEGKLELLALDAYLKRSAQLQDDDAGLQLFLDDFHKPLS
jgi:hypothetical protein